MNLYEAVTVIVCLTAAFAYITERFTRWPTVIGITLFSLIGSLVLILAGKTMPQVVETAKALAAGINFPVLLLQFMLGILLFAGSIQMSERELKRERVSITVLSTFGTMLSVVLAGGMLYLLLGAVGLPMSFVSCLLFGAIVSPTDPISVLSILRQAGIPKSLEVKISGESLFNDGVAVVLFTVLLELGQSGAVSPGAVAALFAREAIGGVLFGLALGYVGYLLIKPVNSYPVEVITTVAIAIGGYALAGRLHVSGALAMVVSGIMIGNKGRNEAMSPLSRDYLSKFWEMIDELANGVLFLLIGLEMLLIPARSTLWLVGAASILILFAARLVSVAVPVLALRRWIRFERGTVRILTWGGLRGGLSLALGLSIPEALGRNTFVPITYMIVVFSILVQGLTIGRLAKRLGTPKQDRPVKRPANTPAGS